MFKERKMRYIPQNLLHSTEYIIYNICILRLQEYKIF